MTTSKQNRTFDLTVLANGQVILAQRLNPKTWRFPCMVVIREKDDQSEVELHPFPSLGVSESMDGEKASKSQILFENRPLPDLIEQWDMLYNGFIETFPELNPKNNK